VVEAVLRQRASVESDVEELVHLGVYPDRYVLATLHRQENVDSPENLLATLHAFNDIASSGWPVVFPVHP
ncbi:UDP-N-acetylglucosamine 2-epimerase, partial [Staphylococcus aureus]